MMMMTTTCFCFLTILIVIIVSVLVIYLLVKLYKTIYQYLYATKKDEKLDRLRTHSNEQEKHKLQSNFFVNETIDDKNGSNGSDNEEKQRQYDVLKCFILDNQPAIYICGNRKCDYSRICNVQICKHIIQMNAQFENEKDTITNVVYIHILDDIVVLIMYNDKISSKDQIKFSNDDMYYINSHIIKFVDKQSHIIFYDDREKKFIDKQNNQYDEYKILLKSKSTSTELLEEVSQPAGIYTETLFTTIPSAPSPSPSISLTHQENFLSQNHNLVYLHK